MKPRTRRRSSELDETLGQLLTEMRLDVRLSQSELALRLCTPKSFVSKLEGGGRRLAAVELIPLARALARRPEDLIRELALGSPPRRSARRTGSLPALGGPQEDALEQSGEAVGAGRRDRSRR